MSDTLVHDTDNMPPPFFGLRLASHCKGITYLCHYRVIYKLGHCRVICNLGHYKVMHNRVILDLVYDFLDKSYGSMCVSVWCAVLFPVPSLLMPTAKHFWKRQYGQRFLCERFMGQLCCSAQV